MLQTIKHCETELEEEIEDFIKAVKDSDFTVGDSFWINDIEFEVIKRRW